MTRKSTIAAACGIVCLTLVVYMPSVRCGLVWDDIHNITENASLRSWDGLQRIWIQPTSVLQYYPLTYTTFWVEYHLWHLNPAGYHLVNILLHSLNSILLGWALARLRIPGAWLAAAVFAIHPLQVESVTWITERKNVLSAFFYFCSLHAYLRCSNLDESQAPAESRKQAYQGSLFFFICALLCKSATCTLPAAILILLWWKKDRLAWSDIHPLILMIALGIVMGLTTIWVERQMGTAGPDWEFTFVERCLIAGRAIWSYAWKWVWPADLTFIYVRWQVDPSSWWQYLFPLAAAAVVAILWRFRSARIGKAAFAAALFFIVSLGPALGFIDFYFMKYSFMADRFQYLAGLGLIVPAAVLAAGRFKLPAAGCLLILGVLTWHQQAIFRNEETLWRHTIKKNSGAWMAYNNLGHALARQGRIDEAIVQFTESLKIKPSHVAARVNLGNAFAQKGDVGEAMNHFREALQIDSASADAHYAIGTALGMTGHTDDAIRHFAEVLRIRPDHADAHNHLGIALARQGNIEAAMRHFAEAVRIRPDFTRARENLDRAMIEWENSGNPAKR